MLKSRASLGDWLILVGSFLHLNMKNTLLLTGILFATMLHAQVTPNWVRYPSISPDGKTVVFTYKGDLFSVSVTGGEARQLTYHKAHDYKAVWSRDGKTIAFASDRYGNFDIFTIDAAGGPAKRLTFHSTDEHPFTFSADDKGVVFGAVRQDLAEHRQYPTRSQPELYKVPRNGGRVDQILTVPAEDVRISADGNRYIYHDKKGGENEFRKHHTSSIARDIWTYDPKTGNHKKLTNFSGEDRNPVFSKSQERIFYLSEESGTFNIHEMDLEFPGSSKQLTRFEKHPIRHLTAAQGVMTFSYDGELYVLREGTQAQKVRVFLRSSDVENKDQVVSISGGVREMHVSPNGKEIAFISRGEVFVTAVESGLTKQITNTPEQERFVQFTHDGKGLVYSREVNGKWTLFQTLKQRSEEPYFFASTLLEEKKYIKGDKEHYLPRFSADGKYVAFIEDRRSLVVMDLKSKSKTTLLTPDDLYHMTDGDQYFTWSPDSRWLLFSWGQSLSNEEVLLLSKDGEQRINLTQSGYYDYYPKWIGKGEQMIWFSNRDGLKSYATSGRTQTDIYTMFFTQEAWDKFSLSKEDYDLKKLLEKDSKKDSGSAKKEDDKKKKKDAKKDEKKEADPLKLDWANAENRKARLTIHSSRLSDAVLSKDGEKLYYLAQFEKGYNLWETELRTKKTQQLISLKGRGGSLQWDAKQENLYLLSAGRISKVNLKTKRTKPVAMRSEMLLDTEAERKAMFEHIWIRTNKIFYTSNFHGKNWDKLKTEYEKYLPHLGNSFEFAEMMSEMLGELNVSHAGAGYNSSIQNGDATASLGIFMDYAHKGDGLRVVEVMKGGPLDKAGLNVRKGDIILSINGTVLSPEKDLASYLNRLAGKITLLELRKVDGSTQQITVKPITTGQENRLLYNRWVKKNEAEVAKRSNGKLGYVHIPGMSDGPYRNIYEKMLGKYGDKKGVIVDTRFNGGGDLVADLAMFFTGEPFISYETEARRVGGEPTSRWTKPTLAMFNESMYSDGHCFASGYTDLKIGKTVGMPVPGTCSFAGWEGLPNGGYWGVVPVSAKNKAGEWMENNQTNPQILVKNDPKIIAEGRDQQLERSVDELLQDVN